MKRLLLQLINALVAFITVVLAAMSLFLGSNSPVYASADVPDFPELDSNLRSFGGLGSGIGLILLWITPTIKTRTILFRSYGSVHSCPELAYGGLLASLGLKWGNVMQFSICIQS